MPTNPAAVSPLSFDVKMEFIDIRTMIDHQLSAEYSRHYSEFEMAIRVLLAADREYDEAKIAYYDPSVKDRARLDLLGDRLRIATERRAAALARFEEVGA